MLAVLAEALLDLHAELARRREDQRARACGPPSRRSMIGITNAAVLPVPVMRQADDVASLERERDRLRLDRRGALVAGVARAP